MILFPATLPFGIKEKLSCIDDLEKQQWRL